MLLPNKNAASTASKSPGDALLTSLPEIARLAASKG
jgi:hypothetical protein